MKTMNVKEFEIGDWVLVTHKMWSISRGNHKVMVMAKLKSPVEGQIVGLKRMCFGERVDDPMCEYRGSYLKVENMQDFWAVKFGMLNKPICTLPDYMIRTQSSKPLPMLHVTSSWSKESCDNQRENMKSWLRDKKGRWVKK